ncbi:hypothetical protein RhiJN_27014 [Ceratobasidium sp. AG-Ba]|nr:hypothetical protein RhiJN_27014 [Ceratobasidium sp. AG-Ba]
MHFDSARATYFAFQLIGLVSLPVLSCTFLFCPSLKRHPTVPNNTLIWTAFSSMTSSLLLFSRQLDAAEPSKTLCRAQSALMLAQPSGVSVAGLAMVWKVWSLVWNAKTNAVASKEPFLHSAVLLGSPWLVWALEAAAFAGLQTGSCIHRITFYCISDNQALGVASGVFAAVLLVLCLFFQVYRRYRESRRLGRAEVGEISLPFFVRIMTFTLIVMVALVLCFIATSTFALEVPDIIVSSIGVLMFLIFGSQRDVFEAWGVTGLSSHHINSEGEAIEKGSMHEENSLSHPSSTRDSPISISFVEPLSFRRPSIHVSQPGLLPTKSNFDDKPVETALPLHVHK